MRIHLPFPISVNAMYANNQGQGRGRFKTKRYKAWIKAAEAELAEQMPVQSFAGPTTLEIFVRKRDKRRRDISNLIKGIEDFLVSQKIIEDDSLVQSVKISWATHTIEGAVVMVRAA